VPAAVAEYLGIACEDHQDYVLEKGNLEFNGQGTLVLNFDCQDDRNPGMSEAQHEAILMEAFGLTQVIWAYGHWTGEGTTGHIDGTARFVDEDTILITEGGLLETENNLAAACEAAGFEVIRYPGDPNWLVGNGFVAAMSSGSTSEDSELQSQIESLFPGRDVFMINGETMANNGGGIHCVTNDQPALP
ncbi:MAG: agmatine deiminase family protein, partial [Proteobacteria bacterium]|nr:agmatine deiminase family protein [Pseudomonadota bacterium]